MGPWPGRAERILNKGLIIFGTGELAEVAAWYLTHQSGRAPAAFTVDGAHLRESNFAGRGVIPFEEAGTRFPPAAYDLFVAVGYKRVNGLRQDKIRAALELGYELPSFVSPHATVLGDPMIGPNAFILEDNTIQPFVRIGTGVTLWSGNHIGHHATIGDFCFISSHVVVSGGVTVGDRTFIGVNATINDHVKIGARCVIGSAAIITGDLAEESVMTAEPAKLSPVPSRRLRNL